MERQTRTIKGPSAVRTRAGISIGLVLSLLSSAFVIAPASAWESGNTAPVRTLAGPATQLRASFDLDYAGGSMYVANEVNDVYPEDGSITVYPEDWSSGDTAPTKRLYGPSTKLAIPDGVEVDAMGRTIVVNYAGGDTKDGSITMYAQGWADGDTAPIRELVGN